MLCHQVLFVCQTPPSADPAGGDVKSNPSKLHTSCCTPKTSTSSHLRSPFPPAAPFPYLFLGRMEGHLQAWLQHPSP
jgi:hypothetical protein